MYSKLFEAIYTSCNSGTGLEDQFDDYLISPLDSKNEQQTLFEKIYFDCNMKPLFEQVLREMAVASMSEFTTWLEQRIQKTLDSKLNLDNDIIKEALQDIICQNNRTTKPPAPFAILDSSNKALVYENASEVYITSLQNYSISSGKNFAISTVNEDVIKNGL